MKPVNSAPPDLPATHRLWALATEPGRLVCLNFSPRLCVDKRVIPLSRCLGNRGNPLKPDTCAAEDRLADPRMCVIYRYLRVERIRPCTSNLEDTCNPLSI
jgi:hypothetical protein